ncbi:MAG TPA: SIR2 family protein, partial [Chloroflexota bacterium]|nr:SIR2 family protein [Chloroflexota bacterium]
MDTGLNERDWNLLLKRITDGKCTPFIGPAVNNAYMPTRRAIATQWAAEYGYPLENGDLARVAQYLAIENDPYFPHDELLKQIEVAQKPDFTAANQPHAVLADLPLPIYITTNYDNLITDALTHRRKEPRRELCRWNPYLLRSHPSMLESGYQPTPSNPLVYHLHGHADSPESIVLTEDNYLDFLVNISSNEY